MSPLERKNACLDLWDKIERPLEIRITNKVCTACGKNRSGHFVYKHNEVVKKVNACSLHCLYILQTKD